MATRLTRTPAGLIAATALLVLALVAAFLIYERYRERSVVTEPEGGGAPVTQVITARLAAASSLRVAELSGTIQSTASDVRGFGLLRSDQVIKMPYSVDYFVDLSGVDGGDLSWDAETRTLVVDAPDVTIGRPNTDEGARTLVQTSGLFVTRSAGEELSRRTSLYAAERAGATARSPERMAQAREHGRRAIAQLMGSPLAALGYPDARVIVTFPPERSARNTQPSDLSRSVGEIVADRP